MLTFNVQFTSLVSFSQSHQVFAAFSLMQTKPEGYFSYEISWSLNSTAHRNLWESKLFDAPLLNAFSWILAASRTYGAPMFFKDPRHHAIKLFSPRTSHCLLTWMLRVVTFWNHCRLWRWLEGINLFGYAFWGVKGSECPVARYKSSTPATIEAPALCSTRRSGGNSLSNFHSWRIEKNWLSTRSWQMLHQPVIHPPQTCSSPIQLFDCSLTVLLFLPSIPPMALQKKLNYNCILPFIILFWIHHAPWHLYMTIFCIFSPFSWGPSLTWITELTRSG